MTGVLGAVVCDVDEQVKAGKGTRPASYLLCLVAPVDELVVILEAFRAGRPAGEDRRDRL